MHRKSNGFFQRQGYDTPTMDRKATKPLTRKREDAGTSEECTGRNDSPGYRYETENLQRQSRKSDIALGDALPEDEPHRHP
jgi:hypothetical protein